MSGVSGGTGVLCDATFPGQSFATHAAQSHFPWFILKRLAISKLLSAEYITFLTRKRSEPIKKQWSLDEKYYTLFSVRFVRFMLLRTRVFLLN